MATSAPQLAPWRETFLSHLEKLKSPSFTLSTLHPIGPSSSSAFNGFNFTPRARTVIYRGMWASLPVNPKNTAELNPEGVYESDLLTITSDARMEKIPELFKSQASEKQDKDAQSGQGGPFEAVFWIEETNTQWRIRGNALVVGPDIDSPSAGPTREALQHHMRPVSSSSSSSSNPQPPFSFARELTAHFGNLSPGMRGSFRNPPPGTPLNSIPTEELKKSGLVLGQKVAELDDEVARKNFRVVVLVAEEVDRVDLTNPDEGKRWNYKLEDGGRETKTWAVTELWP